MPIVAHSCLLHIRRRFTVLDPDAIHLSRSVRDRLGRIQLPRLRVDALAFDTDDIIQELKLSLLMASASFDPQKGSPAAFAGVVYARFAGRINRRRSRVKRLGLSNSHEKLRSEEATKTRALAHETDGDLRIDMKLAMANLPADLLPIAGLLMVATVAEVARQRGIARSTLVRRLEALRRHFEKAGFRIYL